MKERPKIDLGMTGYEEMFMNDQERADNRKPKVDEIPLTELYPFRDHPFKVTEGEELDRLRESIRESGVLVPALARPREGGGYELISGHRRMAASKALGLETLPVIVRDLTDEEAIITMVDANLQREHILPSEKAFAYKMKYDAIKRSPGRTKNASQAGTQIRSDELIAQNSPDSRNQIQRYIRLTNLIPELLEMVDENKIALTPAVELSYLSDQEQYDLLEAMEYEDATPSLSQAQRLHRMSQEKTLSADSITEILEEVKGNQKEYVRVPVEDLRGFFRDGTPIKQMSDTLVKAMEYYNRFLERKRAEDRER